jgi:hypothetical protein
MTRSQAMLDLARRIVLAEERLRELYARFEAEAGKGAAPIIPGERLPVDGLSPRARGGSGRTQRDRVLAALALHDVPLDAVKIAQLVEGPKIPIDNVRTTLSKLAAAGRVVRTRPGLYGLAVLFGSPRPWE